MKLAYERDVSCQGRFTIDHYVEVLDDIPDAVQPNDRQVAAR